MDISLFDNIYKGLSEYIKSLGKENLGNTVVSEAPATPTFPLTVIDETNNIPLTGYTGIFERVAVVGYRIDIYAKTKGKMNKQEIARKIASQVDNFMRYKVGLNATSYNVMPRENDAGIYQIALVYSGKYHENKQRIV